MATEEDRIYSEDGGGREEEEAAAKGIMERIRSVDVDCRIQAAREIRRLTKTSSMHRRHLSAAVEPLVVMLRSGEPQSGEAAILALLNLAVKDERCEL